MPESRPSISQLEKFRPIELFNEQQLVLVAAKSTLKRFKKDCVIFDIGSHDHIEYFLISGSIELESFDGRVKTIRSGSDSASTAIALLQPRKYKVRTLEVSEFALIDQQTMSTILEEVPQNTEVDFNISDLHSGDEIEDIIVSLEGDLKNHKLQLPSFPAVALEIKRLLDGSHTSVKDIATVLSNDPAITVKLLKTCNSVLYRRQNNITSSTDAVVRLGFDTTRQLVNIFVMKEIFQSKNPFLQHKMKELWLHSREVAAMAYVLATITPGMNAEYAMLAALIQDIGAVPILNYLERYPDFMALESKVDEIIHKLKNRVGAQILSNWDFEKEMIQVVENSENWHFESPSKQATYADIAIVAQIHTYIGKAHTLRLPSFDDIPAFKKLGDGGLTPKQSQEVLTKSQDRIAEIKALLSPEST